MNRPQNLFKSLRKNLLVCEPVFIVYLSIILKLFILSTLFDKDYIIISGICSRKIELVTKQMQWKAVYFNEGKGRRSQTMKWCGLRSTMCPGKVNELAPFEKDLIALVKNVKVRKVKNHFQKKLVKM